MKKIVLFLLMFFASDVYAQNLYVDGATVTADGITFEVDHIGYTLRLSNIANVYDNDANLRYKDGRELETTEEYASIDADIVNAREEYRAIRESLGDDVIESLRSYKESLLTIYYVVGSDGTVWEVAFLMKVLPPLLSLPPKTFADLEKKLKRYVRWKPNEYARELQFFHMVSYLDFKTIPIRDEGMDMDPVIMPPPPGGLPLIRD